MSSLVSVVIPVYNSAPYIKETINSVLRQTYSNIEIIVVDDGSTDNSIDIIKGIKDERIRIYIQENQGPAAARNKGMELSLGAYIAFNDADDTWLENKLELQLIKIHENLAFTCISDVCMVDENGKVIGFRRQDIGSDIIENILLHKVTNFTPTLLFKNEGKVRFDSNLRYSEDYLFLMELSKLGKVVNMNSLLIIDKINS